MTNNRTLNYINGFMNNVSTLIGQVAERLDELGETNPVDCSVTLKVGNVNQSINFHITPETSKRTRHSTNEIDEIDEVSGDSEYVSNMKIGKKLKTIICGDNRSNDEKTLTREELKAEQLKTCAEYIGRGFLNEIANNANADAVFVYIGRIDLGYVHGGGGEPPALGSLIAHDELNENDFPELMYNEYELRYATATYMCSRRGITNQKIIQTITCAIYFHNDFSNTPRYIPPNVASKLKVNQYGQGHYVGFNTNEWFQQFKRDGKND